MAPRLNRIASILVVGLVVAVAAGVIGWAAGYSAGQGHPTSVGARTTFVTLVEQGTYIEMAPNATAAFPIQLPGEGDFNVTLDYGFSMSLLTHAAVTGAYTLDLCLIGTTSQESCTGWIIGAWQSTYSLSLDFNSTGYAQYADIQAGATNPQTVLLFLNQPLSVSVAAD